MKKTLTILIILLLAAGLATAYEAFDDMLQKKLNPIKYEESVSKYSAQYNVPEPIIYAVINAESSFRPDALSPKGAIGLMQVTPVAFEWLCMKEGQTRDHLLLYDPDTNIRYGTYFLSLLQNEFKNWETVFAAYNAGRGKVNEWLDDERYSDGGRLTNIPYEETRNYTKKVKSKAELYARLYYSDDEGIVFDIAE